MNMLSHGRGPAFYPSPAFIGTHTIGTGQTLFVATFTERVPIYLSPTEFSHYDSVRCKFHVFAQSRALVAKWVKSREVDARCDISIFRDDTHE